MHWMSYNSVFFGTSFGRKQPGGVEKEEEEAENIPFLSSYISFDEQFE